MYQDLDVIDLRSDTVTLPTDEMREAMAKAIVGDSMRGDDPTFNRLEEMAAARVGKEASLYVPSGSMGNLIAIKTHTQPGDEVIFEEEAHAYCNEVGSFAALASVSARTVKACYGYMAPSEIAAAIRPPSAFFAPVRLLCLENTHNREGGSALTPKQMQVMTDVAREHGIAVHLDGARIFNAATACGVEVRELTRYVDTVQFCLSKGLSAPVGSILAGSREFIERAKRVRKLLGGDMRQAGIIAAAGIVALEKMVDLLVEDHRHAASLAAGLWLIPGLVVDTSPIPTNMVFVDTTGLGSTATEFGTNMKKHGVLCGAMGTHRVRMVTHRHITSESVERAIVAGQETARAA